MARYSTSDCINRNVPCRSCWSGKECSSEQRAGKWDMRDPRQWRTSHLSTISYIGKLEKCFCSRILAGCRTFMADTDFVFDLNSVEACLMQASPSVMLPLFFVYPVSINWIKDGDMFARSGVLWAPAFVLCLHLCALLVVSLLMSAYAPCWLVGIPVVVINVLSVLISREFFPPLFAASFSISFFVFSVTIRPFC